jgi:hypothetical protein
MLLMKVALGLPGLIAASIYYAYLKSELEVGIAASNYYVSI